MEKLDQQQQDAIKKMSTDRLRLKLLASGYEEEVVLDTDRAILYDMYAEVLLAGKVTPAGVPTPPVLTYDVELEKEKFLFKQEKWKIDTQMKEKQMKLEQEQLEVRRRELDREEARKDSAAAKGKLFGDAMRASAIRMGPDILDVIPFFKNVENLFRVYDVPRNLQAVLIRPFFSDRAKVLLTQLDPTITADYAQLKDAVLREFQLSPAKYLERFNTYKKPDTETYVMCASKLSALLNYYLESRGVSTFARLRELLICDRIKLSLSEACLRHVVAIESSDKDTPWLPLDQLTRAVDTFLANHKSGNIPVAMSINQPIPRSAGEYGGPSVRPILHTPLRPPLQKASGVGYTPKPGNGGAINSSRRCYVCNTLGHLKSQCPKVTQTGVRRVAVGLRGNPPTAPSSTDLTDHLTSESRMPGQCQSGPRASLQVGPLDPLSPLTAQVTRPRGHHVLFMVSFVNKKYFSLFFTQNVKNCIMPYGKFEQP